MLEDHADQTRPIAVADAGAGRTAAATMTVYAAADALQLGWARAREAAK